MFYALRSYMEQSTEPNVLKEGFFNSSQGPQHREFRKEILQCKLGCGPQQREIGFPISTDNASWGGTTHKFCENIISVPLPRLFWIMLHHLNDFRQFL